MVITGSNPRSILAVGLLTTAACGSPESGPPERSDLPYEIVVEPIVTLGAPGDSLLLDWSVSLAAGDSLIVAGGLPTRGAFAVYDWQGRQVSTTVAYGGGPGEFRFPRPASGPGDSIWIFDSSTQRVSVLEPDGQTIARAFPLRGELGSPMPDDSGLFVVAGTLLPDGEGEEEAKQGPRPYLHVIDRFGSTVRSFLPLGKGAIGGRIVAVDGDRIWVASMHRPRIEEWNIGGDRLRVIERDLDWFEPWDTVGAGVVEGLRHRPRVAGLAVDGEGRLWVKTFILLTDRETVRSTADYDRIMDTLIEVIDPTTGQLLAQRRFDPAYIRPVAGRDAWATVRQDTTGYVFVDIWRGHLRPR